MRTLRNALFNYAHVHIFILLELLQAMSTRRMVVRPWRSRSVQAKGGEMKIVKKNVFYCEACGKHALTNSIERHEKSCTLNSNRHCNMCEQPAGYLKPLLDDYYSRFILFEFDRRDFKGIKYPIDWHDADAIIAPIYREPFSMHHILGDVDNCPICALAIIRILGLTFWYFNGKFGKKKFDFKSAKDAWWYAINIEEQRADMYG